jgi:hypothetical protein
LGPVTGMELGHGPVDVGFCGQWADHHAARDLVVGQALRDQNDGLAFAAGRYGLLGCDLGSSLRGAGRAGESAPLMRPGAPTATSVHHQCDMYSDTRGTRAPARVGSEEQAIAI